MKIQNSIKKSFAILLVLSLFHLRSFGQETQPPYQQINNNGFEDFEDLDNNNIEPTHWHSFMSATAQGLGSLGKAKRLNRSTEKRPGSSGEYSVEVYSTAILGIIANGNLTTGRINMGSTTPAHQDNYNYTDKENTTQYPNHGAHKHDFASLPDSLTVWMQFSPKSGDPEKRTMSATTFIHGDYRFIAPSSGNPDNSQIVGASRIEQTESQNNTTWRRISVPFEYGGAYTCTTPKYILVNFTTNKTPGTGEANDQLFIDDIELIYHKAIVTNNPSSLEYIIKNEPQSISITYDITGAMFPNTTLQLQLSDHNGSFSNPVILGEATTGNEIISGTNQDRLISGTIPTTISPGTGYRLRVATTDNYVVEGTPNASDITIKYAAPADLDITFDASNCNATLTWTAPSNADNTKYHLYKDGVRIASDISTTSYIDSDVTANTSYQYCVSATGNGTESDQACLSGMCASVYTIAASATGQGMINPSGNIEVDLGASQTFTFTSDDPSLYELKSVLINGTNNPEAVDAGSYTFINVSANHTIAAEFGIIQYQITTSVTGNGTISPFGNVMVDQGGDQTFHFTPAEGCEIINVLIDGIESPEAVNTGNYTFENVTENHEIVVSFTDHVNISEVENSVIRIYPNPTSGELRIRNEGVEIRNVRVFDMTGKLIQEINNINSTELEVDLANFAKGVYFINVDGKTMKVVKQ